MSNRVVVSDLSTWPESEVASLVEPTSDLEFINTHRIYLVGSILRAISAGSTGLMWLSLEEAEVVIMKLSLANNAGIFSREFLSYEDISKSLQLKIETIQDFYSTAMEKLLAREDFRWSFEQLFPEMLEEGVVGVPKSNSNCRNNYASRESISEYLASVLRDSVEAFTMVGEDDPRLRHYPWLLSRNESEVLLGYLALDNLEGRRTSSSMGRLTLEESNALQKMLKFPAFRVAFLLGKGINSYVLSLLGSSLGLTPLELVVAKASFGTDSPNFNKKGAISKRAKVLAREMGWELEVGRVTEKIVREVHHRLMILGRDNPDLIELNGIGWKPGRANRASYYRVWDEWRQKVSGED